MAIKGNKYGVHRVIEPQGVLTQAAYKIDNDMTKEYSNEIVCDVISLNIDSASFTQIEEACGGDEKKIEEMILSIVNERGKMQNPVTGSGGMFIGKVAYIGEDLKDRDYKRLLQPVIDGNEIMEMFHLKPSREVGDLKKALKDAVLDNRVENEREALMQLLMEKAKKMGLTT